MPTLNDLAAAEADCKRLELELCATRKALRLAVNSLSIYEPPDSRACSDEFVALAAVETGDTSERVMAVIDAGLARQSESGA